MSDAFVALRSRDFKIFWIGAIVSNSGNWMQTITVPFVIDNMTHSTTWVGFAAFMAFGPALAMGPIAGSLADRLPRKQVVIANQALMMVAAFALWGLWISDAATPGLIVACLCVSGIGSGLSIASWQSLIPQLVPPDHMLSAIRLNSTQFTAARGFGPALAGFVLAEFGPGTAFLFNAVSFVLVLLALFAIRPRAIEMPVEHPPILEHFRAGVRYTRERSALALPAITIFVVSFFGSSVVQLSAPLRRVFGVDEAKYGLLVGAFGTGALIATLLTMWIGDRVLRSRMAMLGLVVFAGAEILLGAAPAYGVALAGMGAMGLAYMLTAVALNTSIQARVDESHRGRVLSVYLMGLLAGVPLGALTGGALAEGIGLRATIIIGGSALVVFAMLAVARFQSMRPLDEESEPVHTDPLLTNQPTIAGAD